MRRMSDLVKQRRSTWHFSVDMFRLDRPVDLSCRSTRVLQLQSSMKPYDDLLQRSCCRVFSA